MVSSRCAAHDVVAVSAGAELAPALYSSSSKSKRVEPVKPSRSFILLLRRSKMPTLRCSETVFQNVGVLAVGQTTPGFHGRSDGRVLSFRPTQNDLPFLQGVGGKKDDASIISQAPFFHTEDDVEHRFVHTLLLRSFCRALRFRAPRCSASRSAEATRWTIANDSASYATTHCSIVSSPLTRYRYSTGNLVSTSRRWSWWF